jgi:hypothetical protein
LCGRAGSAPKATFSVSPVNEWEALARLRGLGQFSMTRLKELKALA